MHYDEAVEAIIENDVFLRGHHVSQVHNQHFTFTNQLTYGFSLAFVRGYACFYGRRGPIQIKHPLLGKGETEADCHWIAFGNPNHLLGNSDQKKVFSPQATAESIIDTCKQLGDGNRHRIEPLVEDVRSAIGIALKVDEELTDDGFNQWVDAIQADLASWLSSQSCGQCEDCAYIAVQLVTNELNWSEGDETSEHMQYEWTMDSLDKFACMKFAAREALIEVYGRDRANPQVHVPKEKR